MREMRLFSVSKLITNKMIQYSRKKIGLLL